LVLDLVAQADKKPQVVGGVPLNRRLLFLETALKLPIFVSAMPRTIKHTAFSSLLEVAILDTLPAKVSVKKIGPCNNHQDDKRLGPEAYLRVVEDADRIQCRLARLADQFISEGANCSMPLCHLCSQIS